MNTMRVARLHAPGQDMVQDDVPLPVPASGDALIQVAACGLVPNMGQILARVAGRDGYPRLPRLPASFGFNITGLVCQSHGSCNGFAAGDRVYVSPALCCANCQACRDGETENCQNFAILGYFGFGAQSQALFDAYPHGGFGQYVVAPAANLVRVPDRTSLEQATRFGYLATALACLNKAGAGVGRILLINGITGTIGLSVCLVALALGIERILGTGRQSALLRRVEALAPARISTLDIADGAVTEFAHAHSAGVGVHAVVDCLGPTAPSTLIQDAIYGLRRGGCLVNVNGIGGGVALDLKWMQAQQILLRGNNWCTAHHVGAIASLLDMGLLDLSAMSTVSYPLADLDEAMVKAAHRPSGGFSTSVIIP